MVAKKEDKAEHEFVTKKELILALDDLSRRVAAIEHQNAVEQAAPTVAPTVQSEEPTIGDNVNQLLRRVGKLEKRMGG